MKTTYIIFPIVLFFITLELKSQVSVPYHSILENKEIFVTERIPNAPIVELPFINNKEEYKRLNAECDDCDFISKHITVDINMKNSGTWTTLSTGKKIWQLRLKSETAEGLRLICDNYKLPKGGLLYIKNNEADVIYGAFSELNNKEANTFATRFFNTKDITIIYETEVGNKESFEPEFHISKVSHALDRRAGGASLPCHNDVNCEPWVGEWCNEIRATIHLVLSGNGGDSFCSGVLLNNTNSDFRPYIITSRHCTEDRNLATSVVIYNFQSPTCEPSQNGNDMLSTDGISLLYQSGDVDDDFQDFLCKKNHDVALVEVMNSNFPTRIPLNYNVFYAGWNSLKINTNSIVTGIHHPIGDVKKISEGTVLSNLTNKCWRIEWNDGIVERGSSGSPLFGPDHRFIGNLSTTDGTNAELIRCDTDFFVRYGKFQKYFDDIDGWLAPNNPAIAINGIDPIGSCQSDLILYGDFFPASDWQLENAITVQAQNTIIASPSNIPTQVRASDPSHNNLNNTSNYTFRAGQSISLRPGFRVVSGNVFRAEIGDCEAFEGCGFNYSSKIAPPNNGELEAVEDAEIKSAIIIGAEDSKYSTKVYPNPTSSQITIESPQPYQLQIFNLMGQEIGQLNSKQPITVYYMTRFENGVYIFRIQYEDGTMKSWKILKQ